MRRRAARVTPMPFKSKAQRRKFAELLVKGEISPETYEEWNRETGRTPLPERVARTKAAPRRRKTARRKTASTRIARAKAPASRAAARRPATRAAGRASKKSKKK